MGGHTSFPPPTTQPGYRIASSARAEWELHIVHPRALSGLVIALESELVIGRGAPAVIPHETVSRKHAAIREKDGRLELVDLESRNGTWVNGVRLGAPAVLEPQALVRLGDVFAVVDEPRLEGLEGDQELAGVLPGLCPNVERARKAISRASRDDAPALILGETGTGKERVAAALHTLSGRKGAFVPVNCAELSAQLFESELFGHERGAFTGAQASRPGLFRAAEGGTLFLDEVGEIPLELQAKLLRVLQERQVRPVGATSGIDVDVHVVAATNRDLAACVEQGSFRRDLFARLAFWEIHLPALRERRADILLWLQRLFDGYRDKLGQKPRPLELAPDAAEGVLLYAWPDNLRGIERLAHRLSVSELSMPLPRSALEQLLPELVAVAPSSEPLDAAKSVRPAESGAPSGDKPPRPSPEELRSAYQETDGNVRALARKYGRDRRQIYRWLKELGIDRGSDAPGREE